MPLDFAPDAGLVIDRPARIARYRNAHATPFQRDGDVVRGALYDADGQLIDLSLRFSGFAGDRVTLDDPPLMRSEPASPRIEGRGCYIGHVFNHFGHFLTEGLSPLWVDRDFDYYAAHPFVFGGVLPDYARFLLSALGVEPGKIRVIREAATFADITVPERSWSANKAALPAFRGVLDRITTAFAARRSPLRIYLSRAKIEWRAVQNEPEIEDLFGRRGFVVVHPERLGIEAQLALYGQAEIIAGFGGSALHNVLLCPQGTRTLMLGDLRAPAKPIANQSVCAALKNSLTTVIPHVGNADGFDLVHLEAELDAALAAKR